MILETTAGRIVLLVFFLLCAFSDLKTMTVDLRIFLAMAAAEALFFLSALACGSLRITWEGTGQLLLALTPGAALLLTSLLTRGSLGIGDALFFLLTGPAIGIKMNLLLIFISVFSAGLCSLVIIALGTFSGKRGAGRAIPFLPFTLMPALLFLLSDGLLAGRLI